MDYSLNTHFEPLTKRWWKHLLLGFLFVLLGIWIFITPLASYMSLSLFFTLAFVTTGIFEIIASVLYERETKYWGWHLLGGTLDVLIGGTLLFNPVMTMTLLPYILAFWLLYKGVLSVLISLRLKLYGIKGWGWMLASGIGTLIFTTLIFVDPILGGLSIVFFAGLAFLGHGMFNFSVSYHLGQLGKRIKSSL